MTKHANVAGQHGRATLAVNNAARSACVSWNHSVPASSRARIPRVFHEEDEGVGVMVNRLQLHPCRFQHVGIDRIDTGGEALRLPLLQFRLDVVDHGIAERLFQEMTRFELRDPDHRCVEIIPCRLQVLCPKLRIVRDLRLAMDDLAITHGVHHGQKTCHRMRQRLVRLVVRGQLPHRFDRFQIKRIRRTGECFQRERSKMDGTVFVREQLHDIFTGR